MAADIVPVIAAAAGVEQNVVQAAYDAAWSAAKEANDGRVDSKTFVEAVGMVRSEIAFDLIALQAAWKAKESLDQGVNDQGQDNTRALR